MEYKWTIHHLLHEWIFLLGLWGIQQCIPSGGPSVCGITNPGEGIHVSLAEKKTKKLVCAICLCTLLCFVIRTTRWFCIILSFKDKVSQWNTAICLLERPVESTVGREMECRNLIHCRQKTQLTLDGRKHILSTLSNTGSLLFPQTNRNLTWH